MKFIKLDDQYVNLDRVVSITHCYKGDALMLMIIDGSGDSPITVFPSKEELEILKIHTGIDLTEVV
jgi:hypothetical protein